MNEAGSVSAKQADGKNALHIAAQSSNMEIVAELLESQQDDIDVNAQDNFGDTALQFAASNGSGEIVLALLSCNADVNLANNSLETPLHKAVWGGFAGIVKHLLAAGAHCDAKNQIGCSPMSYAKQKNHTDIIELLSTQADSAMFNGTKALLQTCLGGSWTDPSPLKPETLHSVNKRGYTMEKVAFSSGSDRIPAYILIPERAQRRPCPALAFWHQHNDEYDLGKSEVVGLRGNPDQARGVKLAQAGFVVISIDFLCFEERQHEEVKGKEYERFEFLKLLVDGKCLAWKNILDMKRTLDYLCSRPEVNPDKIGCVGHSMGATNSWLLGPFEPRLKCIVANCSLPSWRGKKGNFVNHCYTTFVPGFNQHGDTYDIAALIAPTPLHMNFGIKDYLNPIEEVREGVKSIERAYAEAGVCENFTCYFQNVGHDVTDKMVEKGFAFLKKHLRQII